jgi:uncharacterized protein (TIGR03435 family)
LKTSRAVIKTICGIIVISSATLTAQAVQAHQPASTSTPAAAFDVVSVKPSDPKDLTMRIRPGKDSFTMTGASLKLIIMNAYDLHDYQIEGAPAWINSARFDILAKMDAPSTEFPPDGARSHDWEAEQKLEEVRLQSLLADRFKLRAHKGTKEMPIYDLEVSKGGPRLEKSTENKGFRTNIGEFTCSDSSMDDLASLLSGTLNRTVVDKTGLTGGYKFSLKWTPDEPPNPTADLPGLFTALQEQLGLKLVPAKGPVEILSIDHVEMPSQN